MIAALAVIVIARHAANVRRLFQGRELRTGDGEPGTAIRRVSLGSTLGAPRSRTSRTPLAWSARARRDRPEEIDVDDQPGPQGRHPGRGTRHPVPAGDEEPAQGDAPGRRQAVDPVRGGGGGPRRPHRHPDHHRPGQARDRGPLRPQLRARVLPGAEGQATTCSRRSRRPRTSATSTTSARRTRSVSATRSPIAREHVGNEPFAVLLGDDIMVDDSRLLRSMLDVHDRYGRSVLALMEVTPEQISSYGCVEPEAVEDEPRARAVDRREAEEGRRAVEPRGDRSLRVHARDLRRAGPHRARRGRRAAAHRRDRAAQRDPDGLRPDVHRRSLRHRPEGRLPPGEHRARARPAGHRPGARAVPRRADARARPR